MEGGLRVGTGGEVLGQNSVYKIGRGFQEFSLVKGNFGMLIWG